MKKKIVETPLKGTLAPLWARVIMYFVCGLLGVLCVIPLLNVLAISLSHVDAVRADRVFLLPIDINFDSYRAIFGSARTLNAFGISVYKTIIGVALNTVLTILASYPLSKNSKNYPTRNFYVVVLLFCMLFNGGLVPTYILVDLWLGLHNNIFATILPTAVPIFNIILMMNFFRQIPKDIEEAAFIDGASYARSLWRIVLPLSTPVIATVMLYQFVFHWNDWQSAYIYMSKVDLYPLQTYLQATLKAQSPTSFLEAQEYLAVSDRTLKSAQIIVTMIPMMIVYPFVQKYFAKGIVLGAVKG